MMRFAVGSTLVLAAVAAPALAQNSSATPPAVSSPPPKTEAPPPATTAPPATASPPETTAPADPPPAVIVQPAPQPVPQQPVAISPDAAYPNGFADPADPFANEARAYNDQEGFDWGLLGLLGLLGLIPLIRGSGPRTIYVERDEPRRVVRERIDEDPR